MEIPWYSMIYNEQYLPFAIGAGIVSLMALFIDYLYFYVNQNKESILGITYRGNNIVMISFTWFGGGLIVLYLFALIGIFDTSVQAMITLGILWPVAFTKLINSSRNQLGFDEEAEEILSEEE